MKAKRDTESEIVKVPARERATFHLPVKLTDRARNCVFWTPGLTMAALVTDALNEHLNRLEKKNQGPFTPRSSALKGGRQVRST